MEDLGNDLVAKSGKVAPKYYCEKCDYECFKIYNWKKHLVTSKHTQEIIGNGLVAKVAQEFFCEKCEKSFHTNAGLWKHNKKCKNINESNDNEPTDKELMLMVVQQNALLIKENSDFKNIMMEVIKNGTHNNTIHSNSHNKTFNLQFFLNETCKDAMNIMDFVDSIKIQLSDLENVGKFGYIDGISKIIVQHLNLLDETKRPVHCTDSKREVLYVKDENKWEKENEDKQKMRKVIKHVTHKNTKLFNEFRSKYPGCEKSESKFSNKYDKLIIEAFGGKGDNTYEKEDKIIRKIAKEVTINK
jgi:hypothetical protein